MNSATITLGLALLLALALVACAQPHSSSGAQMSTAAPVAPILKNYNDPATVETKAGQAALPIKVSADGRYFVDQQNKPVFWLGTTQWELFRRYTPDEARLILDRTAAHGFTIVLVMIPGVGDGTGLNFRGEKAWLNDDPTTPNEAYFQNVDAVLKAAADRGLVVSVMMYHQAWRKHITLQNARQWARWIATRYKDTPNIYWSLCPEAKASYLPVLRELAAGLQEGDGGKHLISVHPDPSPTSSSFIHTEPWLAGNTIQTWADVFRIYPMVTHDYQLTPTKPVVMAEGAYEHGSEYHFDVTPLWVRRQAYYSYLVGGHHAYGHNDSWRFLPTWKPALDAPGAVQMGILKSVFMHLPQWWQLVPDQSILTEGGKTDGKVLNLAARQRDGRWIMVYLAEPTKVTVDLAKLAPGKARAYWVDPRTGDSLVIADFSRAATNSFATPVGWEDALLMLEAPAQP